MRSPSAQAGPRTSSDAGAGPAARRRGILGPRLLVLGGVTALLIAFLVAAFFDYRNFDQTSGGYDPPYTGWTGTPIDWDAAEVTEDGFRRDGVVLDSMLNCTTGMISFRAAGVVGFNFREVSPRAIAVHKPREACREAGFSPEF